MGAACRYTSTSLPGRRSAFCLLRHRHGLRLREGSCCRKREDMEEGRRVTPYRLLLVSGIVAWLAPHAFCRQEEFCSSSCFGGELPLSSRRLRAPCLLGVPVLVALCAVFCFPC